MPLVQRSDARWWQESRAEAAAPSAGSSESGSVVTAITRPAPIRTTAQSVPSRGPVRTSGREAPSLGAMTRSNSEGVILPSAAPAAPGSGAVARPRPIPAAGPAPAAPPVSGFPLAPRIERASFARELPISQRGKQG